VAGVAEGEKIKVDALVRYIDTHQLDELIAVCERDSQIRDLRRSSSSPHPRCRYDQATL
jgi:hypothetical protein